MLENCRTAKGKIGTGETMIYKFSVLKKAEIKVLVLPLIPKSASQFPQF